MRGATPNLRLIQHGYWSRFWPLLRSASVSLYRDGCFGTAKGVAYSALLAFFPMLTTIAAILVQARAEAVSRTVARLLYDVVPPGTEDVVRTLFVVHGERPAWVLVAAVILALWAASGAMMSLMEGFRSIYRIPKGRSFFRERGVAMLLVATSALPVIGASWLIVFGRRGERDFIEWLGMTREGRGWVLLAGQGLRFLVASASIVIATALVYYWGPNCKQQFRQVVPGAILAMFLWLLATLGFGLYVEHVVNYNVLYGSVGAGLALLVWMYVLAVIVLLGCEFNSVRDGDSKTAHR
jgi:membrane protein